MPPITHVQGLQLANSLIAGTSKAAKVNAWKKKYCIAYSRNGEKGMIGNGYWHGFMRRHGHQIKVKRGVKFNNKQSDWCTYSNFKIMYDVVYTKMVAAGIAAKLATPVMLNKTGKIVELEEESFSLKTHYMQLHPNKLVFVDEVGSNTSQTKDGHCGGEKFLVPL